MTGQELLRRLRQILNEDENGAWMDDHTSYDYLYEAATEWVERTHSHVHFARIQTRSDVATYDLPANFLKLFESDKQNNYFVTFLGQNGDKKLRFVDYEDMDNEPIGRGVNAQTGQTYWVAGTGFVDTKQDFSEWETTTGSNDGAAYLMRVWDYRGRMAWGYMGASATVAGTNDGIYLYQDKFLNNSGVNGVEATPDYYMIYEAAQGDPDKFCITVSEKHEAPNAYTCASTGAIVNGESWFVGATSDDFIGDGLAEGDYIYNTTDGSEGRIIDAPREQRLRVALFGGTNNYCSSDDSVVVVRRNRQQIHLTPTPSASNDLIHFPYIAIPHPVFSDHRAYTVRDTAAKSLVKYAAFLYKFRDSEPDFGNVYFIAFDRECRKELNQIRPFLRNKRTLPVNMRAR